ncbi:uncharacterized protein B0I36DRAFT_318389 [Microdochium trichocladiopsis]|uniref:Uncharacterized protein n=1 Tax=Microdochium trichocladiopsis TaxID=1682393 RepID=A0A9P8Y9E8_9PEZI|nr:uncharacterized protein B0I36DRAFT_318389 [Microdochium trichocladiopsis]KAH7035449.1 hypothetical protein B0I36DRAFT_318389 [Microdochium trichocladiopsis]
MGLERSRTTSRREHGTRYPPSTCRREETMPLPQTRYHVWKRVTIASAMCGGRRDLVQSTWAMPKHQVCPTTETPAQVASEGAGDTRPIQSKQVLRMAETLSRNCKVHQRHLSLKSACAMSVRKVASILSATPSSSYFGREDLLNTVDVFSAQ